MFTLENVVDCLNPFQKAEIRFTETLDIIIGRDNQIDDEIYGIYADFQVYGLESRDSTLIIELLGGPRKGE